MPDDTTLSAATPIPRVLLSTEESVTVLCAKTRRQTFDQHLWGSWSAGLCVGKQVIDN